MGRIRTIKPEFPQSETVGKLSREARLLFVQLWTFVDDEGRSRAASRMLASLLYPYDDDAPSLIDHWLDELEANGCLQRYEVDETKYLEITNWSKHQKVDHPTKSRIPAFSREFAKPREPLAPDLGPRTMDQGDLTVSCAKSAAADEIKLAFDNYNALAERIGLSRAQRLNDQRKSKLRARLRDAGGIAGWDAALDRLAASKYCRGEVNGFKADLDFLLQETTFIRLMEGRYDDRVSAGSASNSFADGFAKVDAVIEERRRRERGEGEEVGGADIVELSRLREGAGRVFADPVRDAGGADDFGDGLALRC